MDDCPQVSHTPALAARTASWLLDEEANAIESGGGDALG
jgi:hypothetical protein